MKDSGFPDRIAWIKQAAAKYPEMVSPSPGPITWAHRPGPNAVPNLLAPCPEALLAFSPSPEILSPYYAYQSISPSRPDSLFLARGSSRTIRLHHSYTLCTPFWLRIHPRALNWLCSVLQDLGRVGIFGGSAGGQSTMSALLHYGELPS